MALTMQDIEKQGRLMEDGKVIDITEPLERLVRQELVQAGIRVATDPYATRSTAAITGIAIHHSADFGTPLSWARYHMRPPESGGPSFGPCPKVCYHAAVMRDGKIYKMNFDSSISWHTADNNSYLIGIVLQGDLTQKQPTAEQWRSLLWVVQWYRRAYPKITIDRVRGHKEWKRNSTCPGDWPNVPGWSDYVNSPWQDGIAVLVRETLRAFTEMPK